MHLYYLKKTLSLCRKALFNFLNEHMFVYNKLQMGFLKTSKSLSTITFKLTVKKYNN